MAKSKIDKKRYPVGDPEGQFCFSGVVSLTELNKKRLCFFFPDEQIEHLVNDVVDNALTDFLVFVENIDNEKFMAFYNEMVSDNDSDVNGFDVEDDEK